MRITTKPLQSNFMSQLDHFSNKLMQIFKSKGGVKGQRIKEVLSITDSRDNINTKRECILRCLIYLNEDPDTFKEYLALATEDAERDLATTVMGIYVIRSDGDQEPEDVGVVIEGDCPPPKNDHKGRMCKQLIMTYTYVLKLNAL
ncbi:uncharacterized protein LOC127633390 [Xyrauchen texanus]|uniref:uncharacterized protein LOC127633390 n=1 Tax=Xyrauchen texanus TaxID=154827 RepID=UPI002242B224|nr:uncharacterized protein LOC127633390 [Xyrauchen texanus]